MPGITNMMGRARSVHVTVDEKEYLFIKEQGFSPSALLRKAIRERMEKQPEISVK